MNKKLRTGYTTGASAAAAAKAATILLLQNIFTPLPLTPSPTHRERGKELETPSSSKREVSFVFSLSKGDASKIVPSPLTGEGEGGGEGLGSPLHQTVQGSAVEIPFPDGSRVTFKIQNSELITQNSKLIAWASVIKDAGDDPDITNGAEIVAEVRTTEVMKIRSLEDKKCLSTSQPLNLSTSSLIIKGGEGVGIITKPGLSVPVGEPAINPVPRRMIKEAVMEAILEYKTSQLLNFSTSFFEVTISVPDGKALAKKTLNSRLGILGGISILGTTGVVKPISSEAWTATISASMDVAKAMGYSEIVLSAGRASEKAHIKRYNLHAESYVMMGDYLEFSLLEAEKHSFKKIHLSAQWAKMLKIAMATPQTHVRHGAINIKKAVELLNSLGINLPQNQKFNTAREIFDFINASTIPSLSALTKVCAIAKRYAEGIVKGASVVSYLVSYEGDVIADSG